MSRSVVLTLHLLLAGVAFVALQAPGNTAWGAVACYPDLDSDGYGDAGAEASLQEACGPDQSENNLDCNDGESDINPGASDIPGDGVDQNCDGVDRCYLDRDLDGWAGSDEGVGTSLDCDAEPGYGSVPADCDDSRDDVYPGAPEVIGDDVDQDCDGNLSCYVDLDSDGFGNGAGTAVDHAGFTCNSPPDNVSDNSLDCDDTDTEIYPGNAEICDGKDNNCADGVDEGGVCGGDTDGDGTDDALDDDDDNDGVLDGLDADPVDPFVCEDQDFDGCDDCSIGVDQFGPEPDFDPLNDGPDADGDGQCDAGDPDADNDSVPNQLELDEDTDDDNVPNWLDPDDDGDGILTIDEDYDDGDPTNDDSDDDQVSDYLDPDDDGDGILTIDEDRNGDGDPTNDDFDQDGVPDYLDPDPIPAEVFEDGFESDP